MLRGYSYDLFFCAMNCSKCFLSLAAVFLAAFPERSLALTYDIAIYKPSEIAERGITIDIHEKKSGALDCTLMFDKEKIGKSIASVELSSQVGETSIDLEMRLRGKGDDHLACRFTLSRELMMHGKVSIGLIDEIPGGTFLHVAFIDFVDFGLVGLSDVLKRRQLRLLKMGLLNPEPAGNLQERIAAYESTARARDAVEGAAPDQKRLIDELNKLGQFVGKTRIKPYEAPAD